MAGIQKFNAKVHETHFIQNTPRRESARAVFTSEIEAVTESGRYYLVYYYRQYRHKYNR